MANLLEWPSWTIVDVQEGAHDYHITAYRNDPPAACVSCGAVGELQLFGKREHPYLDLPMRGKRVGIHAGVCAEEAPFLIVRAISPQR